jgi:hypothetical protein
LRSTNDVRCNILAHQALSSEFGSLAIRIYAQVGNLLLHLWNVMALGGHIDVVGFAGGGLESE